MAKFRRSTIFFGLWIWKSAGMPTNWITRKISKPIFNVHCSTIPISTYLNDTVAHLYHQWTELHWNQFQMIAQPQNIKYTHSIKNDANCTSAQPCLELEYWHTSNDQKSNQHEIMHALPADAVWTNAQTGKHIAERERFCKHAGACRPNPTQSHTRVVWLSRAITWLALLSRSINMGKSFRCSMQFAFRRWVNGTDANNANIRFKESILSALSMTRWQSHYVVHH